VLFLGRRLSHAKPRDNLKWRMEMKNKTFQLKSKGASAASALVLAMASGFAQAALVTEWTYSTNAVFSGAAFTTGSSTVDSYTDTASELSWGRSGANFLSPSTNPSDNRSALTVGDFSVNPETKTGGGPAKGSVLTVVGALDNQAEIGKGISLTHWNNVLDGNFLTLTGATITDTITLTPKSPAVGSPKDGPTLTFEFQFRETPNNGTNGVCADGLLAEDDYAYVNSGGTSSGGCPDLFGYVDTQVVNQSFNYDGFTYFISVLFLNPDGTLDTIGIPKLSQGECSALGLETDPLDNVGDCSGFKTLETQATTKRFGFAISARPLPVPEPGTLALMGLALAGMGAARYRKSR